MKTIITAAAAMAIVAFAGAGPALADHHHHHHHYNKVNRFNTWDQRRDYYSNNWRRINSRQQRALDAQMRAQWNAYHHNSWNGNYSWNNYNDPAFLQYLNRNNPSLFTRIGSYIGL